VRRTSKRGSSGQGHNRLPQGGMYTTNGRYDLSPNSSTDRRNGRYTFDPHLGVLSANDEKVGEFYAEPCGSGPFDPSVSVGEGKRPLAIATVCVSEIIAEIQKPENADAVFVLPSQLNGVEYPSHDQIVLSVSEYKDDNTGGPRGQLAVHPAAAQFLLDNAHNDQRVEGISAVAEFLQAVNRVSEGKFALENGYLKLPVVQGESNQERVLDVFAQQLHLIKTLAFTGLKANGLTPSKKSFSSAQHSVNIVYASAVPIQTYNNDTKDPKQTSFQEAIAQRILFAQYAGALRYAWRRASSSGGKVRVFLLPLGGGVFKNPMHVIVQGMACAFEHMAETELKMLDIRILAWEGSPTEQTAITAALRHFGKFQDGSSPSQIHVVPKNWSPSYGCTSYISGFVAWGNKKMVVWTSCGCMHMLRRKFKAMMMIVDPILDIIVAINLYEKGHYWWFSFSSFFLVCAQIVLVVAYCSDPSHRVAFKKAFGWSPHPIGLALTDLKCITAEVCGCGTEAAHEAYMMMRHICEGAFESLPQALFQSYIGIRQTFLGIRVIDPTLLPFSVASSVFMLYSSYQSLSKFADKMFEGNVRAFLFCLLQLGVGMPPINILEDLTRQDIVVVDQNLDDLDMQGLRALAASMRDSHALKTVQFINTKMDNWYKIQSANHAQGYAQGTWVNDFCNVFCSNRGLLESVRFSPELDVTSQSWSFDRALRLREVQNGDARIYSYTEPDTALRRAVNSKDYRAVSAALQQSNNAEIEKEAIWAARLDHWKVLREILVDDPERVRNPALLSMAAAENSRGCLQLLLACRADINAPGAHELTPLEIAAQVGHKKSVRDLLGSSADPNANCPLHEVALCKGASIAQALIDAKADVNARKYRNRTPLHYCADYGSPELCAILLANGADIEARDDNQDTPLTLSARRNTYLTLDLLVEKKADQNAHGLLDRTALEWSMTISEGKAIWKHLEACKSLGLKTASTEEDTARLLNP